MNRFTSVVIAGIGPSDLGSAGGDKLDDKSGDHLTLKAKVVMSIRIWIML